MQQKFLILGICIALIGLSPQVRATISAPYEAPEELNLQYSTSKYDSIIAAWEARNLSESLDLYIKEYVMLDTTTYIPALTPLTDEEYIHRLNGIVSFINLPYNEIIRKHIVAYTTTHRRVVQHMLGESQYYFPQIEHELEKAGLPLELKFLPVIESALRPTAVSPSGAVGLWQFMLPTGRQYGLEITTVVDARRDPVASTKAACAYLKDLYNIYNDWTLAIASYNYGPGNVNKAIKRAGPNAKTYWDIYPYLPKETRDYIPALVGITYAYHYYKESGISPSTPSMPLSTDTVTIHKIMHLEQVSSTLDLPLEVLQHLNPQYKENVIPAATKPYPLVLPQSEISHFIEREDIIYGKDSIYLNQNLVTTVINPSTATPTTASTSSSAKIYKVKKGDTLGGIAQKHGVTVAQLSKWNSISSKSTLRIGQALKVKP